jgi:hypothetical protein
MQIRLHVDFPFIIELPIAAARTCRGCGALVLEAAVFCPAGPVRTAAGSIKLWAPFADGIGEPVRGG